MLRRLMLAAIRGYQLFVSPLLGPRCRFAPSCSAYAAEAIGAHGAFCGSWLALKRILRCHPLHPGGYDPVPTEGCRHRAAAAPNEPSPPSPNPTPESSDP